MMRFLDVFKWREVGSVSCAFWAAMLGDQAVNLVGQDSGLTARNQPHGEVTASDQSPDRTRGDVQTPRDPGLRNPLASSLELHEPPKRTVICYQHTRCSGGSFPKRNLAASFRAGTWFQQSGRLDRNSHK